MSTQRKFNYSFRNRNSNRVEKSQGDKDGTDEAPSQVPAEKEVKNEPRSFPSECETEDFESQKIPPLDQPISAAELEHRKSTIRGTQSTIRTEHDGTPNEKFPLIH